MNHAGTKSHQDADGANTPPRGAERATRETAGEPAAAAKWGTGAQTSLPFASTNSTAGGRTPAPVSVSPELANVASEIWRRFHPSEILYFEGAANVQSELHDLDLDEGYYLIVYFPPHHPLQHRGYFARLIPE